MPEQNVVISIRNLRKTFANHQGIEVTVLDSVTFDVTRGETVVIMGGSGCGKSTLLNCLIGEYRIDGGEILYHTKDMDAPADITGMADAELDAVRKHFGILFQSGALFNSLTVAEKDRKSTRLNSSHTDISRMPSSA